MDFALLSRPAFSIIACMIWFFCSFLATIKIISFSAASETPINFSACSIPVPLAWITVPPYAPASLAASITRSTYPWFKITTISSCNVSFKVDSSFFWYSFPSNRNWSAFLPPILLSGMVKAIPPPGASICNFCWSCFFTCCQVSSSCTEKITAFSLLSRPR